MRLVYSGAGPMTIMAVQILTEQGHEVIIIELNNDKIDLKLKKIRRSLF